MTRAVFDTNVVVAGFLSPSGLPGRIVEWLREGVLQAVVDDRIVAEYREVLLRSRFELPPAEVDLVLAFMTDHAHWVCPGPEHEASDLPDVDDAPFLECARAAGVAIVTGNRRHFPKSVACNVPVLSPAEFLSAIRRDSTSG